MNSRSELLFVLLASLFGTAAAACGGETQVVTNPPATGISVQGTGEITAAPDISVFNVGVQVTAPTVAEARDRAAASATAIIESVKAKGVEERDIRTIDLQVYPRYDYRKDETVFLGYDVVNTLEVRVRDLDRMGDILDGALEAGGDDTRVNSIRFEIDQIEELVKEARELAMTDARAKAEQMAELAGVTLGPPLSISEFSGIPLAREIPAPAATGPGSPIQPGTSTVTVSVSVMYAIDD
jgi:uncharacterized protein YggE